MSELTIQYLAVSKIVLDQRNPRVAPALESIEEANRHRDFIELALGQFAPDDEDKGASTYTFQPEGIHPPPIKV